MRYLILILFSVLLFSACGKSPSPKRIASPDAKLYALKGKIVSVDKAKKEIVVAHEKIPGFMEAMTMPFPVNDDYILDDLTKDADLSADLVVDTDGYWLENFAVSAAPNANQPALPVNENFAQVGREISDFSLLNQDGKRITLKDFRGKSLAITFIYSRCPLPEYCILMSENFSDTARRLQNSPELKDKIRLLSISFDPATDTPQKLKEYGLGYLGKNAAPDFTVWQLATGTDAEVKNVANYFGLQYETDAANKTLINHSLVTFVIAPDGKVSKVFPGNDWTPDDLLRELEAAAK
ncbi:MAG: SCO family protein [Acidobacteriota bacterium]|nr:SCO family protein [Acidobacteriota bacterium]